MSKLIVTIVEGVGGLLAFIIILIAFLWFCKQHYSSSSNNNSESEVEWNRGGPSSASASTSGPPQGARQFRLEELNHATNNFSDKNIIGYGSFGAVYKALLHDGAIVAIKRRPGASQEKFFSEVAYLTEVRHRNLVTLLGYCQEGGTQMLVFEYITNGSICNHLYDLENDTTTKLEFKQRLSTALGAAKGLCHLHRLKPPLVHRNFKTSNVLVDEKFTAKIADAGILRLLESIDKARPSTSSSANPYQDPDVGVSGSFSVKSDVYSFGVFLLELTTGREAVLIDHEGSNDRVIQWVKRQIDSNNFVDHRLTGKFTVEGMKELIRLTLLCMSFPAKSRPKMETVETELERICEKEMAMTTVMGEGTTTITLGSQLFRAE